MNPFQSRLNLPILRRIIDYIPGEFPTYLVGGAIRDAFLNRPNVDLDFVIQGDAMGIARKVADSLHAAYFPLDTKRQVARVIVNLEHRPNKVGISSIKIDFSTFQGTNLNQDLIQRDFTMNAMAVEVHDLGKLVDPLGGLADLHSKQLKTCSPTSFLDDPVRILRAVRFSVDLGLRIPPDTLNLLKQAVGKITEVSTERMRDELFRILLQSHPSTSIRILDKLGVLEYIMPEVAVLKDVKQSPPHVMDVWGHTLDILVQLENLMDVLAVENNPDKTGNLSIGLVTMELGRFRKNFIQHFSNALNPERPHRGLIFLAGLYHDVGKLEARSVDESGKIKFIEHERIGSLLAEKRGKALRLSNQEIERLVLIVGHHMRPSMLSHEKEAPTRRVVYRFFRSTGAAGVDICLLSLADILATYGPTLPQERWTQHLDVIRTLLSAWWEDNTGNIFPSPIINGDELMEKFNLSPGPMIGFLLEAIREEQVAGEIHTQEEAFQKAQSLIEENRKTGGF